jgi:DNA polymerase-3 subunit delta'
LWRAARAGRLAHAVSFVGRAGIGKFLAAEWLTFGLLCARAMGPPCGSCGPCKRLKSGSHPDVFVHDAEGDDEESIPVSQIAPRPEDVRANVVEFLALRAMEGGARIVLVREADRMTTFAQNTLLKTLEEPGGGVLIVLETARPELLLPTVHSRCLRLDLRAPPVAEARAVLLANGLSEADATDFARWTDGAPGAALALASRGGRAMRELIARRITREIGTSEAASEFADIDGRFSGRTAGMVARARARAFLDLALAVTADGVRAAAGADSATLAHGDLVPRMSGIGRRALRSRLDQCLRARQDVDLNLAPEAIIERALRALGTADVPVTL